MARCNSARTARGSACTASGRLGRADSDDGTVRRRLCESAPRTTVCRIPEKVHPYKAGLWGGIAGGIAMAILACIYGQIAHGSIWYPVNLLAATVLPSISHVNDAALNRFDLSAFGIAVLVHAITSILVGVLYAMTLPMFPRRAPLWAGFIVPLFWTGLIASTLALTNPTLNEHINWLWFVICQIAFGLVAGFVAAKTQSIDTMQNLPFIERAAIESQWRGRARGERTAMKSLPHFR